MTDETVTDEVTPARAEMLAQHAIYVQGGYSDPEREAARARTQLAESPGSIDWDKMQAEVDAALAKRYATAAPPSDDDPGDPGLDTVLLRRYRDLRDQQKIADAEASAFKEEADAIEAQLIDQFTDAGMQSISIDGKTIYLHEAVYARKAAGTDTEDLKAALRASGHGDLVSETVNGNTLNAWVRELTDPENPDAPGLPDELDGILERGERYSVRIVASRAKSRTK